MPGASPTRSSRAPHDPSGRSPARTCSPSSTRSSWSRSLPCSSSGAGRTRCSAGSWSSTPSSGSPRSGAPSARWTPSPSSMPPGSSCDATAGTSRSPAPGSSSTTSWGCAWGTRCPSTGRSWSHVGSRSTSRCSRASPCPCARGRGTVSSPGPRSWRGRRRWWRVRSARTSTPRTSPVRPGSSRWPPPRSSRGSTRSCAWSPWPSSPSSCSWCGPRRGSPPRARTPGSMRSSWRSPPWSA